MHRAKEGGRSGKGRFLIQASRWILLPCIKMQKTGGGDRFGLKIIFKEIYPNSKIGVVTCLQFCSYCKGTFR